MAETSATDRISGAKLIDRLLDAILDSDHQERTVLALLAAYAAVWSAYGAIAKSSQDLHFDMGEMVAWSREAGFGTPKHPPLPAWLVRAWFSVFPQVDWAYYMFAAVLATAALWFAWKASAPYLSGEKRLMGLALLTLVPFYNFQALKFNANSIMTPLWALATWWFLRSYDTRRPRDAVLAGIAAAACMLGKYWSIMLLAGLGVAALADPRRGQYLRSSAPWLTIAAGLAALAPHVVWLYAHDFAPFGYALESHAANAWDAFVSGLGYVAGAAGYVAVPTLVALWAAQASLRTIADTLWPPAGPRRQALIAFVVPLVLPVAAAVAAREEAVSLWSIGSMTLFPVVLLSSPQLTFSRPALRRILALAIAVPMVALALSPAIAFIIHRNGLGNYATQYRLLAQAVDAAWQQTTPAPLRLIGSNNVLLYGTLFYFPERPSTFEVNEPGVTPWTDEARIAREGIALFCAAEVTSCIAAADARAAVNPAAKRTEVELSSTYFGHADQPQRYVIVLIPPAAP
jgi:4-amino-4-deoxy-L-arabinose transferase-like glycosyltransferase